MFSDGPQSFSTGSDDIRALVADVLTLAPAHECERYLPPLFNADELAWQLDLLLRAS